MFFLELPISFSGRQNAAKGRRETAGDEVLVIGLDFGSTTSRALIARSRISRNQMTGCVALDRPDIVYRAEPVLTPFKNGRLHELDVLALIDRWLDESGCSLSELFAGGVIITGLAARLVNAHVIASTVQSRINNLIAATANDPHLESWLGFMGNTRDLSVKHPEHSFLNLDIGGGTTNIALGRNGNVNQTGCYLIGARHFQFQPGTYRLTHISEPGQQLARVLGLKLKNGNEMTIRERDLILDTYLEGLISLATGAQQFFTTVPGKALLQSSFSTKKAESTLPMPKLTEITYSGGVGELIYRASTEQSLPGITYYGDLGIDLALRILEHPVLNRSLAGFVPVYLGQSIVYGLAMHSAEISGNTVYLPDPALLPLNDLPIVARLDLNITAAEISEALALARKSQAGGCIQINTAEDRYPALAELKRFGQLLAAQLEQQNFPENLPLLLVVPQDYGKVMGNYATRWGRLPVTLIAVDEVPEKPAQFVSLGAVRNYVIPVYFYGMH